MSDMKIERERYKTQEEYDAIKNKNPTTLYWIVTDKTCSEDARLLLNMEFDEQHSSNNVFNLIMGLGMFLVPYTFIVGFIIHQAIKC